MSTDKFHIGDAGRGNDAHSDFLMRMGYGDLLNRPGRQEMTIDTASMYKKAAIGQGEAIGTGLGALAGGIGGAEIADAMGGSATAKLLGALTGAGLGGVGGYFAGGMLDKSEGDDLSISDKNTTLINQIGGAGIGGLTGYGISKYLVGSKNRTHHLLSAGIGAGIGAGAGTLLADDKLRKETRSVAESIGKQRGYTGDDLRRFTNYYVSATDKITRDNKLNKDKSWLDRLTSIGSIKDVYLKAPTAEAIAQARMEGKSEEEAEREVNQAVVAGTALAGQQLSAAALRRIVRGGGKKNKRTTFGSMHLEAKDINTLPKQFLQKYMNNPTGVSPAIARRMIQGFNDIPGLQQYMAKGYLDQNDVVAVRNILQQEFSTASSKNIDTLMGAFTNFGVGANRTTAGFFRGLANGVSNAYSSNGKNRAVLSDIAQSSGRVVKSFARAIAKLLGIR